MSATPAAAGDHRPLTVGQILALGAFLVVVVGWPTTDGLQLVVVGGGAAAVAALLALQRWPHRAVPGVQLLRWTPDARFGVASAAATMVYLAVIGAAAVAGSAPPAGPALGAFWVLWLAAAAVAHHRAAAGA